LSQKHLIAVQGLLSSGALSIVLFGLMYIALSQTTEYNIALSQTTEYNIALSQL